MRETSDRATLTSGRLRRLIFWYVSLVMLTVQALFVLTEALGYDFDPRYMVWLVPAVIPITLSVFCTWAEGEKMARAQPAAWGQWAMVGAVMFVVWAGVYFVTGRVTDPSRVRYLPTYLEAGIPLRPNYTLLYITLYPIFLLPFFVVRDRAALQRLVAANLLMLATCSAAFLAVPIGFDRPPLPPPPHDFGTWILALVQGNDPAWNCLPSEHCAAALIAALACWEANRKVGLFALMTTLLIGVSTLYTKQHYVVDVFAGYGVSLSIHWALRWSKTFEGASATGATNG